MPTIVPRPRRAILSATGLSHAIAPMRLISIISRSLAVSNSSTATAGITPAAYTTRSRPPRRRAISRTRPGTSSIARTSWATANARSSPAVSLISSVIRSSSSSRRATIATRAPSAARRRASASPIPDEAPMTRACENSLSPRSLPPGELSHGYYGEPESVPLLGHPLFVRLAADPLPECGGHRRAPSGSPSTSAESRSFRRPPAHRR